MTDWNLLLSLRREILMDELERKLQRARNEMLAERFGRIEWPAATENARAVQHQANTERDRGRG